MSKPYDNILIKETAVQKELNATQVAAAAGRSVPTVYQVYAGSKKVGVDTLDAIVRAVGLQLSDVIKPTESTEEAAA